MRRSLREAFGDDLISLVLRVLEDKSDLRAMCLVSQADRIVTEPVLYRQLDWTWSQNDSHDYEPPLARLLRTVLVRPGLASHVHGLKLDGDFHERFYGENIPKLAITRPDIDSFIQAINNLALPYAQIWIQDLCAGNLDAIVALLVSQLHHLRHLFLGPSFTKRTPILGNFLRSALCGDNDQTLPKYSRLETVHYELTIDYDRPKKGMNTADVLPFFYLMHVRCLFIALDNPIAWEWPTREPPVAAKITALDLTFTRESHIARLLSVTPNLRSFRWRFFYGHSMEHALCTSTVDLNKIVDALTSVRLTLEDFSIVTAIDSENNLDPASITIRGSLKGLVQFEFPRLVDLRLPLHFLTATFDPAQGLPLYEVVPRTVRSLTITDDLEEQVNNLWDATSLCDLVTEWLGYGNTSQTGVQTISILVYWMYAVWDSAQRDTFIGRCAQLGVQIHVTNVRGRWPY